jgi:hypothetical protein
MPTLEITQETYLQEKAVVCGVDYSQFEDVNFDGITFTPTMLGLFLVYQINTEKHHVDSSLWNHLMLVAVLSAVLCGLKAEQVLYDFGCIENTIHRREGQYKLRRFRVDNLEKMYTTLCANFESIYSQTPYKNLVDEYKQVLQSYRIFRQYVTAIRKIVTHSCIYVFGTYDVPLYVIEYLYGEERSENDLLKCIDIASHIKIIPEEWKRLVFITEKSQDAATTIVKIMMDSIRNKPSTPDELSFYVGYKSNNRNRTNLCDWLVTNDHPQEIKKNRTTTNNSIAEGRKKNLTGLLQQPVIPGQTTIIQHYGMGARNPGSGDLECRNDANTTNHRDDSPTRLDTNDMDLDNMDLDNTDNTTQSDFTQSDLDNTDNTLEGSMTGGSMDKTGGSMDNTTQSDTTQTTHTTQSDNPVGRSGNYRNVNINYRKGNIGRING